MKAIIIDDEKMARMLLEGMLNEYNKDITVAETCSDLASGVLAIRKHKPDIVFLDIEMPGHSGLEILNFFGEDEINFSIVFITAYNQYALQAFKLSAVDYLLKPIEAEDLDAAIAKCKKGKTHQNLAILKENLANPGNQKIAIPTLTSTKFIETKDIVYFKAEGAYTKILLKGGSELLVSKGLKRFEESLAMNKDFFRSHKSYLVNINFITEHIKSNGGSLILENQYEVGLSADKVAELHELMNWVNP